MPRWTVDPMRTFMQVVSASCWMMAITLTTFCCHVMLMGSFSSAVYSSISMTVRFPIRVSAA